MANNFSERHSDGVHRTAYNVDSGHFENVMDFPFDAVDRNLSGEVEDIDRADYSLANLGSAVNVLLSWFVKGRSLENIAGRALVLHWYLRPAESDYSSISEIATACNCTRAALSKALLELRDSLDFKPSAGKLHGARQTYSEAQKEAFASGSHVSFTRKDRRAETGKADPLRLDAVAD
jgi:hypothetical protein